MKGGAVEIGQNNVFHVRVYLMSEGGNIKIGNFNIFEDKVMIYNTSTTQTMYIGNFNHVRECSRIQSSVIQHYNEIGINTYINKCNIGIGNIIGDGCKMRPSSNVWNHKTIALNGLI